MGPGEEPWICASAVRIHERRAQTRCPASGPKQLGLNNFGMKKSEVWHVLAHSRLGAMVRGVCRLAILRRVESLLPIVRPGQTGGSWIAVD
jgi:hypothetical protein